MPTRRHFLAFAVTTIAAAPALAWLTRPSHPDDDDRQFPIHFTDEEWRRRLTPAQYRVLRRDGTERPFSSPLAHETAPGTFLCSGCDSPAFESSTKFESGTGWPSFWRPLDGAVATSVDRSWLMIRTEVHCARCGGHLGHVFPDGPPPTGLRYCMNGVALRFRPV
jgi:peptide-methionine (R)-S-oxide reductase